MFKKYSFIFLGIFIYFSYASEDMVCEDFKLSYIKADQLLGILKSMGYNVIEFESTESESFSDLIFEPNDVIQKPLSIIKFPNFETNYLQGNSGSEDEESEVSDFNSYIGSSPFPYLASGDPLQRILICYDNEDIDPYIKLVEYIKNKIDVSAKQIMVDALVIEINSSDLKEIGLNKIDFEKRKVIDEFSILPDSVSGFIDMINNLSLGASYSGNYTADGQEINELISLKINALLQNTSAEILSKPSVLVLDGRQARIQIGEQIPISKYPVTNTGNEIEIPDVEYLPVGITLNLRPRIGEDNRQITMQVETIITETSGEQSSSILSAPTITNRKVESFVRIANNTPFIVGGLISNKNSEGVRKIPFLHKIPILGNLFKSNSNKVEKREVIVVITPHIIEDDYKKFSKVIPQDSDFFNSTGNKLFSNSYRLEEADIWDFDFITNSEALKKLRLEKSDVLGNYIPGEEYLVNKMLYEVIEKTNYFSYVNPDNIILFEENGNLVRFKDLDEYYLNNQENLGIALQLKTKNNVTFERPIFNIVKNYQLKESYNKDLRKLNENRPTILLTNKNHRKALIEVFILKYLLEINESLEFSIQTFKRGLEIKFPNPQILENNTQLLDKEVTQMFYQVYDYYYKFEKTFNDYE
jgi:general secretion pathway protein D